MGRGARVPTSLPILLSTVQTGMGGSSLMGCRPGVGSGANTNTLSVVGWLSGSGSQVLTNYRGASNLNMVSANAFTGSATDTAYGGGSAGAGVEIDIFANGTMYVYSWGMDSSNTHGNFGHNDNKWLWGTTYDNNSTACGYIDMRFTKRGGTGTGHPANNTWVNLSTPRSIYATASRSSGGTDSESLRGWLAFRKAGDTSNTLIGNTFIDLEAFAASYTGPEP